MKNNSEVCSVCQNGGARGETLWHRVRGQTGLACTAAQSTRGDGNTLTTVSAKHPFSSPGEGTSRVSFSSSLYGPAIVSLLLECSVWPPLLPEPTALCWASSQASTHRAWAGLAHVFLPLSFRDNTLVFLFPPFFLSQDSGAGRPLANDFKADFRKRFQGARL